MADSPSWGLLSVGAYGNWQVDIDEPLDSDVTLFAVTLEHPGMLIRFHITSLSVINSLIDFLDNMNSINFRFEIEGDLGASLRFVFDEGRLFVWNISPGRLGKSNAFRVRIDDDIIESLTKALKDAVENI